MKELKGKTAVITGAASGIGRELAIQCAAEDMNVVLADVDEAGLVQTDELLRPANAQTLRVKCDVSKPEAVEHLAARTCERFGAAHLLFNNAGVVVMGPIWTSTPEDWRWTLGVNFMGVVHGIQSFVPRMLQQNCECHIVNTASAAGLLSVPGSSAYVASKHGVVAISECLHHELALQKARIRVSVLCPAFVPTAIIDSARNRPAELAATNAESKRWDERMLKAVRSGKLSAADIARITLESLKENRFYILTHPAIKPAIAMRMTDIIEQRDPSNPMP